MSPLNDMMLSVAEQQHNVMMYSPEAHLCGLCQATLCRNEHTLLMLELDEQPRKLFLRTVSRNRL